MLLSTARVTSATTHTALHFCSGAAGKQEAGKQGALGEGFLQFPSIMVMHDSPNDSITSATTHTASHFCSGAGNAGCIGASSHHEPRYCECMGD